MPLEPGQIQVRDLVMDDGTTTPYMVLSFNPWNRQIRASGEGENPWGHGGYSGAEWLDIAVVNMDIHVIGVSDSDWMTKQFALMQAFAPVETGPDVELRWMVGDTEYMMRGRPRMLNPTVRNIQSGEITSSASFVCLDPLIYSGELHEAPLGLPRWSGGLAVPVEVPVSLDAELSDGVTTITNAGMRTARVLLRFDGPVSRPAVTLAGATLALDLDIPAGHWVDVDTLDRTVLYDGHISRLQDARGSWPVLPPGSHELRFTARRFDPDAALTVRWRDTY